MAQLTLFDSEDRPAQARRLAEKLHGLAGRNVFFGTSSWKYEGWLGEIYRKDRYVERGRFSQKKFESECLREYAETFPVVGGDFSFYQFPSPSYWKKLFDETPPTLKFGLKVPEEITVPRWPGHARYGTRAGTANQGFLDNRLFHEQFTWPLERYRDRVAALIFEFGRLPGAARSLPGLRLSSFSLLGGDPQSGVPGAGLLLAASVPYPSARFQRVDANAGTAFTDR